MKIKIFFWTLFIASVLKAQTYEVVPEFEKFFKEAGVVGSIVVYDYKNNIYKTFNDERNNTEFLPASTFKIINSLIFLETGVIKDADEIIQWDGIERFYDMWNQDQTLRSAFKYSTVWVYQELARKVGEEKMQNYVDACNYGNKNIGGGIDRFWLDGDIRITPYQQIEFLVKFYENKLPFSDRTFEIVKDIFIKEKTENYTLRGKTGWAVRFKPQTGWFVGYLEKDDNAYFFATQIAIEKDEDTKAREKVTRDILAYLGLM
ncbi:MAG: class D beta-lactamase [Melioribacteraceae bacterium]|nr:class D beta-lactamase [Melioribacteraceae bacterium]MCO6474498.1 class D beta-lactamase [Melioribacteraceae bacterium]MDD3559451.1 class D beta-lactamase [Melioribacteraceae bacterium]